MESKTYSQKVDEWLFAKSGFHIIDFCRKFGYNPLDIKIMALDENDEKKSKTIINKDSELKSFYEDADKDDWTKRRKGKNRSYTAYFKELIKGWVLEDLIMAMLKEKGIDIEHNGHDADRRIKLGVNVTQESDFSIKVGNVVRRIELSVDKCHFLEERGFLEKRAPALRKVWERKEIWLAYDYMKGKYILVDFATEKVRLHLRNHDTVKATWSKKVHRYILSENNKKLRDDKLLAAEIISVVGCSIDGKEQPPLEEIKDFESPNQMDEEKETSADKISPKERACENQKADAPMNTTTVNQLTPEMSSLPEQVDDELPPDYDYGDGDFV